MPPHEKVRIPVHVCTCGYRIDSSVEFTEKGMDDGSSRPTEGMLSLCAGCAKLYIFKADQTLRDATDEEMKEIMASPDWKRIQKMRQHIITTRIEIPYKP